jgi:hypothetical protein
MKDSSKDSEKKWVLSDQGISRHLPGRLRKTMKSLSQDCKYTTEIETNGHTSVPVSLVNI